jgi:hypothetical protein
LTAAAGEGTLLANVVRFVEGLREREIEVTTAQLMTAVAALRHIDAMSRGDFREALAASLLTSIEEREAFDVWFDEFWSLPVPPAETAAASPPAAGGGGRQGEAWRTEFRRVEGRVAGARAQRSEGEPLSYSPDDVLMKKDFSTYTSQDVRRARRLIRALAPRLATARSRRQEPAQSGREPDLRRSLREAARRGGGEVARLLRRRRKLRKLRLALLCDVSGSMDVYSRFLVQFVYAMQAELPQVNAFLFSTRLYDVTQVLRGRRFEDAMAQLAKRVEAWSGGTDIGGALRAFNVEYARRWSTSRLVVVLLSDGWDRGDTAMLAAEMARLKRVAYRLIWLNPLLGNPEYRPLTRGMAAALPFLDEFLPAHSLASLARLGSLLGRGR